MSTPRTPSHVPLMSLTIDIRQNPDLLAPLQMTSLINTQIDGLILQYNTDVRRSSLKVETSETGIHHGSSRRVSWSTSEPSIVPDNGPMHQEDLHPKLFSSRARQKTFHRKKTLEVDSFRKKAFDKHKFAEEVRHLKEMAAREAAHSATLAATAADKAEKEYKDAVNHDIGETGLNNLVRRHTSEPSVVSLKKGESDPNLNMPSHSSKSSKKKSGGNRRRGPSAPPPPSASIRAKAKAAAAARAAAERERKAAEKAAREAARPKPLSSSQIERRTERGRGKRNMIDEGIRLDFAWQSQRGYYPDEPRKRNQDALLVIDDLAANASGNTNAFFAVFDGHGKYGDLASNFVRKNIASFLEQNITNLQTEFEKKLDESLFDRAYASSYEQCNQALHNSNVDDSVSGTTAVSALITGRTVKIANIGDSRIVVARREEIAASGEKNETPPLGASVKNSAKPGGKLVGRALSQDQTPYRKDERERCKAAGARVMSLDMMEGRIPYSDNWGENSIKLGEVIDMTGDPPRIWHPKEKYPGNAFTRSIGDALSEPMGVFATPEISTFTLDENCEFFIIASDGIWEFLTNQDAVDIVAKFDKPSDSCNQIVKSAYEAWLDNDTRTDDITCIVVKVSFDGWQRGRRNQSTEAN